MKRLTKQQAAIIGLFTGIACGPFADIQKLADDLLGHSTFTHQFADKAFWDKLKELVEPQFLALCYEGK